MGVGPYGRGMQPSPGTTKRQLIDLRLGGELDARVRAYRAEKLSWRVIARRIADESGIDITGVSLADWYPALDTDQAAS